MRILPRPDSRYILLAVALCLIGYAPGYALGHAQVLAQRNWAGSGVTIEPWWRRAVFYRMDPETFQDSNGDGKGDLAGVTQRLDYLQSLGVDALILKGVSPTAEGLEDLARAAVGSHVRVLVELGAPASQSGDAAYIAEARQWLNQGAAGLYVPTGLLQKVDGAGHIALLLHQLRAVTDSFPGGRVLLADAPSAVDQDLVKALAKETQLTASAPIAVAGSGGAAASLRTQLMADLGAAAGAPAVGEAAVASSSPARGRRGRRRSVAATRARENNPLLLAARVPADMDAVAKARLERALAVMLLASRSAVMLEYGEELGLDGAGTDGQLMQWTPTNVTRKLEPPAEPVATKPAMPGAGDRGFQAYIPPLRKDLFPPPRMPVVTESDEAVPVVIDPNTLAGFTAGTLDASRAGANGATANVAMEQADPSSLLNLYRQLIQLHHDNPTVRNGAETVLDYDAVGAVVWVRRAIANSRTSATVVGVCNLSDKPVVMGELGGVRVRGVRALVGVVQGETVAAGAVVVGEVK
jgi:hypothetical protein